MYAALSTLRLVVSVMFLKYLKSNPIQLKLKKTKKFGIENEIITHIHIFLSCTLICTYTQTVNVYVHTYFIRIM